MLQKNKKWRGLFEDLDNKDLYLWPTNVLKTWAVKACIEGPAFWAWIHLLLTDILSTFDLISWSVCQSFPVPTGYKMWWESVKISSSLSVIYWPVRTMLPPTFVSHFSHAWRQLTFPCHCHSTVRHSMDSTYYLWDLFYYWKVTALADIHTNEMSDWKLSHFHWRLFYWSL